jgi:hypothetical protein
MMLRLDMIDSVDQSIFLQPLLDLMLNVPSFCKLGLYNVRSTKGLLDRLLVEGAQHSHLTHFTCHTQESHKEIMALYAPAWKEMVRHNVYLKQLDIQGTGYSLNLDWEEVRDMYLRLNQFGRRLLQPEDAALDQLITVLHNARDDITSIFYFLSHKPSLWTGCCGPASKSNKPMETDAQVLSFLQQSLERR